MKTAAQGDEHRVCGVTPHARRSRDAGRKTPDGENEDGREGGTAMDTAAIAGGGTRQCCGKTGDRTVTGAGGDGGSDGAGSVGGSGTEEDPLDG